MAMGISRMVMEEMGVMVNDSTMVDCIDLITYRDYPIAFPGRFARLLRAASVIEINGGVSSNELVQSEDEVEELESRLEWMNRGCNMALPGAKAERERLKSEVASKKAWIEQHRIATRHNQERNEQDRVANMDRWHQLVGELKDVHHIEDWQQLDANRHNPVIEQLYIELYAVNEQRRCFDRHGRSSPLVSVASLHQAAKELST
jgi:hypothetical protein